MVPAERAAREKARREREEAVARERYVDELAARESSVWRQIDSLITTKKPGEYDRAIGLLRDLKDVGSRTGRTSEIQGRIGLVAAEDSKKTSFVERLREAGLPIRVAQRS